MAAEFLPGNRLILLEAGAEYFPALIAAIEAAQQEIFLETYIFADDAVGQSVAAALADAARRGVAVRVLVDGIGARDFMAPFLPRLQPAGVKVMAYRPEVGHFHLKRHRLRRLHRKLVVIDGCRAFVGGINIIDDHNAPDGHAPRFDYAVLAEGPVAGQVHQAVRQMWEIVAWANFKRRYRLAHPFARDPLPPALPEGQLAAFLKRDNILHRNEILNAYLGAISGAKYEILIANAYFLPGVRFGQALLAAVRRGVRVTILLQGQTDHPLMHYATQALYETALKAGLRIYEYEKSFLHAKVAVVDDNWATVGSSNIDPFSLLLAKEGNLVIRDARFARQLRARVEAAMASGARAMALEELARQPWPSRLLRWLSYGLVRFLTGVAGYGQRHWQGGDEGAGRSG